MSKLNINKKKILYVVTMYKFGERDLHSYIMGVFSKKPKAINVGLEEKD